MRSRSPTREPRSWSTTSALGVAGEGSDLGPAEQVVEEIRAAGGEASTNGENVADFAGAERLVQQAIEEFGRLDILVNNAGILRDRMIVNMTEDEWDAVIAVHLKGHFAPTRHAAAYWRERSKAGEEVHGRVINTASPSGVFGNVGQANYGAAKAGIAGFTIIVAQELQRYGVTVNCLAPNARTRMTEETFQMDAPPEGFDPLDPANVSAVVVALCADEAQASRARSSTSGAERSTHCAAGAPTSSSRRRTAGSRTRCSPSCSRASRTAPPRPGCSPGCSPPGAARSRRRTEGAASRARPRSAPLRRHRRARRRLPRGRRGLDRRPDRPERRRQDDGLQRDHAPLPARFRRHRLRRPLAAARAAEPRDPPRHRPHLPEPRAVPDAHRARERPRRRRTRRPACSGSASSGARHSRRWPTSGSPSTRSVPPPACPSGR